MTKGPSKNLTWKELKCKDGTEYPLKWRESRLKDLAFAFETIRGATGNNPITVTSAYRTESYNKKIGGARFSQHVQGRALDLKPPKGYTVDKFYEVIRKYADLLNIRGIGKYPTFVHIDTRVSKTLVVWNGSRTQN